ncbi:acyl carrier protein [Fundidesulfovibrio soli]|uniref:acyl carrier protein n=1 Tax=Fundidesulfovibrio soli TaxID=2922716 RepID=UPI002351AA3F|nr:phosphopantetheine-binding protein [Fundidesulfovibrio soli]
MDVTTRELRDLLVEAGVDQAVAEAVRPDAPLLRQGVDSLDYPAFTLAVESRYGVTIGERDSLSLRTLDDFAAHIRAHLDAGRPEDGHIGRIRRNWKNVEPGKAYEIGPLRPGDGQGVAQLFYTVYGDRYPVEDYYIPERIEELNAEGSLLTVVARLETGVVAGQGAYYRSSPPNKALFEFGQVMVAHEYRDTLMAAKIIRAMDNLSRTMTQAQGFFGEAVCSHTITQKLVHKQSYSECGLEVALMPDGAYEKEGAGAQRVSCLLGARVDRDRRMPLHLPQCYRRELEYILDGFRLERDIHFSPPDAPAAAVTSLESRAFDFAQVVRAQVLAVGADFPARVEELDRDAASQGQAVIQVFVNTGAPGTAFAVEALRARGFFLGGLIPLWFGADGLLMQKLTVEPEFEAINLHSDRAKTILEHIRADFDRARAQG